MSRIDAPVTPCVVQLDIDEDGGPTGSMISSLTSACDAVEDAAPFGVLELHVRGSTQTLPTWPGSAQLDSVHKWEKVMRRLDRLVGVSLVVVAGRRGPGTLELLASADHRIAAPSLQLHLRAECDCSWPSVAMHRVAARSGPSAARRLFMFAASVNSARAMEYGLVDVVTDDTGQARNQFLASLAGLDLRALASRRMLLSESRVLGYERAVGLHLAACDVELRRRLGRDSADTPSNGERADSV